MRYFILLSVFFFATACAVAPAAEVAPTATPNPYPAAATIFRVNPSQSNVNYIITETFLENVSEIIRSNPRYGEVTTVGATRAISGNLAVDLSGATPMLLGGDVAVDLTMLRTSKAERDEILKVNWLESVRYPIATFAIQAAENIEQDGTRITFDLVGDLTIHGVTQPVSFDAFATLTSTELIGEATATLQMSSFGVTPPRVPKIVEVEDTFELKIVLHADAVN